MPIETNYSWAQIRKKYAARLTACIGHSNWSFDMDGVKEGEWLGGAFSIGDKATVYHLYITNVGGGSDGYVASFYLSRFPGCCGIAVSHNCVVYPPYKRRGLGTLLNLMRLDMAHAAGYTRLICTDVTNNEAERKILRRNGWTDIGEFRNRRTSNFVAISIANCENPAPVG